MEKISKEIKSLASGSLFAYAIVLLIGIESKVLYLDKEINSNEYKQRLLRITKNG